MSFSFESEHSNSKTNDSDTESQLLSDVERSKFRDENEKLKKEIDLIRAQFDQAMEVTKKVETLHDKNQKLAKEIREVKSENEDLRRKLEISQHANEEVHSKLKDERVQSSQQRQRETIEKEREITKLKKELEKQVQTLTEKINQVSGERDDCDLKAKMLSNKLDRIMNNAVQYFQQNFTNFDALIDFLSRPQLFPQQPPPYGTTMNVNLNPRNPVEQNLLQNANINQMNNNQQQNQNTQNNNDEVIQCLKKKVRINRNKIRAMVNMNETLGDEINKLKRENKELEKKHSIQIQNYENQISTLKDDFQLKMDDAEDNYNKLLEKEKLAKNEVEKLKIELKNMKAERAAAAAITPKPIEIKVQRLPPPPPPPVDNKGNVGFKEEAEALQRENNDLSAKLEKVTAKNEQLSNSVKNYESINAKLEIDNENYKNKFNALQTAHDESLLEIESLRQSLHLKPDKTQYKKDKKLFLKFKNRISQLEKTIKEQMSQIHDLSVENEQRKRNEDVLQTKVNSLKNDLEESQQQVSSLSDEISITRQLLREKPTTTVDDLIPLYAWKFNEFEPELSQSIDKVISNPLLQPASKLNNVYKCINKHFTKRLKKQEEAFNAVNNGLQTLKEQLNQFIIDLSILIQLKTTNINDFIKNKTGDQILQKITEICQNLENEKRQNAYYQSVLDNFSNEFGNAELPDHFIEMREQLNKQSSKLKKKNKKIHTLNNVVKTLKKSSDDQITNLKSELTDLTTRLNEAQLHFNEVNQQNAQIKKALQQSKNAFLDYKVTAEEKEKSLIEEHEQEIENRDKALKILEDEMKDKIAKLTTELEDSKDIIQNSEASIDRLKAVIKQDQKTISEKDEIIKEIQKENQNEIEQITSKNKLEKDQLIKSYESVVEEIKKQCEAHRSDLEKVSAELSISEKKNNQAKSSIVQLRRDKMKLEHEIKSVNDQMKRDKQVNEANFKAKILSTEEEFSSRLQEAKSKWEKEKRRIFTYAADEFKSYYNPSESMDEKTYRAFLSRIKKELDRLSESDTVIRRLICAAPQQPTDDAVAQYIMG